MSNDLTSLFLQKPRTVTKGGANYGTPYKRDETPIGEHLAPGEVPNSLRKTFRHHPEIEALSFLPDSNAFTRLQNDIATHGIQVPIVLWRTQRETTDGRTVTEYFIVDGYLRMAVAEELDLTIEDIPWIVNEDIQTLEDALNTAARLKMHRAHYNECEHKYMIGLRYLQEKRRVGAPLGSKNALRRPDEKNDESILDNVQNDSENNGDNLSPLFSVEQQRTYDFIARELNLSGRTILRYANVAEQIEIAVAEIQKRWKVSRGRAIRCCTQIHVVKKIGNQELDARPVTAADWGRLDLQPGCFDRFPLVLDSQSWVSGKDKLHYHDEREEAIVAAVRELVTPPRMRPDVVDAEIVRTQLNISHDKDKDTVTRTYTITRNALDDRMEGLIREKTREELMQDPEFCAWYENKRQEAIQRSINLALTSPDRNRRISALKFLAMENCPLPTDELDPRIEAMLRPKFHPEPITGRVPNPRDVFPMEPEWRPVIEASQECDSALRAYRDSLVALEETFRKLVSALRVADDLWTRGKIKELSSWQDPGAKRMKETFLELAKILADTNVNHQALVVNRDPTIHARIKALAIEAYDTFAEPCSDIAREINISTRYASHKKRPLSGSDSGSTNA
jgi:hypothetical protein